MPLTPTDVETALDWGTAVARRSSEVPRRRRLWPRSRGFLVGEGAVFIESVAAGPWSRHPLFLHRWTAESVLTPSAEPRRSSGCGLDVLLPGPRRSDDAFRFRGFLLAERPAGERRSVVVQQRRQPGVPNPLVAGLELQATLVGQIPLVVPRVLDVGALDHGTVRLDWAVEEMLDGHPVPLEGTGDALAEAVQLLQETWIRTGTRHLPLRAGQRDRALAGWTALVADPPPGGWPADVDAGALTARVVALLGDGRGLTVGVTHGDPSVGNMLRMPDGGLALVDWEFAARRHVAHDVAKVIRSAPDPVVFAGELGCAATLRTRMESTGALPWPLQVAAALLVFLGEWRPRHARSVSRGRGEHAARGLRTAVRLVDVLTG
ncbi:phosphotransferase [Auraticoccus monumenti]|nr:phosphotransferase [Auraticoccus monumenti]